MSKDSQFNYTNWYQLWMDQSKEFFETANKNLAGFFGKGAAFNPEEHLQQINEWLESMKKQWAFTRLSEEQKNYQNYWNIMTKMCNDASDLMVEQWIKRSREKHPVQNIRELYELWLNCCHEIFQRTMQTDAYQEAYGQFMNAAFKIWKSTMPK